MAEQQSYAVYSKALDIGLEALKAASSTSSNESRQSYAALANAAARLAEAAK